jgi:hypothetical protein
MDRLSLIIHTNKCNFYNIMKSKIHIKIRIKTIKTLLHVSILRSSSRSINCSLLKLYIKTVSKLLRYINPVLWQRVVCLYVRSTLCRERILVCILEFIILYKVHLLVYVINKHQNARCNDKEQTFFYFYLF